MMILGTAATGGGESSFLDASGKRGAYKFIGRCYPILSLTSFGQFLETSVRGEREEDINFERVGVILFSVLSTSTQTSTAGGYNSLKISGRKCSRSGQLLHIIMGHLF